MSKQILIVEDDRPIARVYLEYLKSEGFSVNHVEDGGGAIDALSAGSIDLVLLDLHLPDMGGLDILKHISEKELPVEVIVITSNASMNNAIEAMKLGASDFLVKPCNKARLVTTVENALERQTLDRVVQTYREEFDRHEYQGFVGSSLVMQSVYRVIDSAAQSKASVFITGESGTGKEVCAEAIHRASSRASGPFIAINCSAIPRDLIESEVFGHVKGAFTGATANRKGAAQLADGGTLFLDEIGEMDINLQSKLLRFLQNRQVQPVGGSSAVDVDVRVICATNRDPLDEIAQGRFREDLFYRLHVLPIHLPSLQERDEDILEIGQHFLTKYSAEEGKAFTSFAPDVEARFLGFDWPGNVRQLQNVIRNIVVLHDSEFVDLTMLPAPLDTDKPTSSQIRTPASIATPSVSTPASDTAQSRPHGGSRESIRKMADIEQEAIENALEVCEGSVPEAAHYLGISAATIYRKKASWKTQG